MTANTSPTVSADQYYHVTLNQSNNLNVVVNDVDTVDNVTLTYTLVKQSDSQDLSHLLAYDNSTLTWAPSNSEPVELR